MSFSQVSETVIDGFGEEQQTDVGSDICICLGLLSEEGDQPHIAPNLV